MNLLCKIGIHDWEINQVGKVVKKNTFILTNYHRTCQRCWKEQSLQRPEKYHPSAYVWTDLIKKEK